MICERGWSIRAFVLRTSTCPRWVASGAAHLSQILFSKLLVRPHCGCTHRFPFSLRSRTCPTQCDRDTRGFCRTTDWIEFLLTCVSTRSPSCSRILPRTPRRWSSCTTQASSRSSTAAFWSPAFCERSCSPTSCVSHWVSDKRTSCSSTARTSKYSSLVLAHLNLIEIASQT